jgi:hypothetical protein
LWAMRLGLPAKLPRLSLTTTAATYSGHCANQHHHQPILTNQPHPTRYEHRRLEKRANKKAPDGTIRRSLRSWG